MTPTRDGSCHCFYSSSGIPPEVPKSQPSDPATAEDPNLRSKFKSTLNIWGMQGPGGFLCTHPKLKPSTRMSGELGAPLPQLSQPSMKWLQVQSCTHRNLWSSAGQGSPHTLLCSGAVYSLGLPCPGCSQRVSDLAITTSHSRITTTIISKETGTHTRIFYVISHIRRFSRDFAAYF